MILKYKMVVCTEGLHCGSALKGPEGQINRTAINMRRRGCTIGEYEWRRICIAGLH